MVLGVRVGYGGGRRYFVSHQTSDAAPGGLHGYVSARPGGQHGNVGARSGGLHGYDQELGPAGPGGLAALGIDLIVRGGAGSRQRGFGGHQTSDAARGGLQVIVLACAGGPHGNVGARARDLHSSVPACSGGLQGYVDACAGGLHDDVDDLGPAGPGGFAAPDIVLVLRGGYGGGKR